MLGAGVLGRSTDLTNFVYDPSADVPRNSGGGRPIAIIPAIIIAIAALAAASWFGRGMVLSLWRRLPRPKRVAGEAMLERVAPSSVPLGAVRRARPPLATPPSAPRLPAPIDLNAVLAPLERRIRQRVRGKVRWRFSLLAALWPCRTEGGAVAVTVLDLVAAAAAAMDADGTLIIGTRNFAVDDANIADYPGARIGEFARITVRDSGPGLSDDEFQHILDPATTARPAVANAASVMERLGGFLRVESAEGIGTAVHLYFARVGDAITEPEEIPADLRRPTAEVAE
jgi:hypothetical protein